MASGSPTLTHELSDLLERFRRGGELLAVATTGAAGPELDFKPKEDSWCVRQVVCHLADAEAMNVMRLRMVIAEDHPTLQGFNGDQWAVALDYGHRKVSQAIETFRRLRTENYELLKNMPEVVFSRTGNHTEMGSVSLFHLVKNTAEHTEDHVRQIQTIRAAYREHRAKRAAEQAAEKTAEQSQQA